MAKFAPEIVMPGHRILLYVGLAAVAGFLVAQAIPIDSPPTRPAEPESADGRAETARSRTPASADIELADLRGRLRDESSARRELERKVDALERRIGELAQRSERAPEEVSDDSDDGAGVDPAIDGDADRAWFDEQALIASGINEARAQELRLFFEQLELERLRLRDRAAREGWDRSARRTEFEILEQREESLRERLGENEYAAYLYASGRPNRVEIASVLASAPAGQAGIRAGDQILRYANERIYSPRELRAATAAGTFGEPVEIEVERDGEALRFYLARGPMGVRTDALSIAP
jgi:vacuolar-type H+-ATPase subunit I/STV1